MKKHQLQPSGRKLQLLFFGPFVVGVIAMFSIDFSFCFIDVYVMYSSLPET
jgi:hypothetical protein